MNVSVLSPYSVKKVEIIQNTYAIVAQDASDSSGLAVLETNVILKPTHPHHYSVDLFDFALRNLQFVECDGSGTTGRAPSPAIQGRPFRTSGTKAHASAHEGIALGSSQRTSYRR